MGLDVALGIVILIAAIRGWLQGFVYQAVRLGGMIACVYLAAPVRDQAKPYILPYLPTVKPVVMDRLLWWVAAALAYIVLVGATTLVLKMTKRPEIPGVPPQRSRNDQFAGFLLGIAKGALISAFFTYGVQTFALKHIESIDWARDQVKTSMAIRLDNQYHPAARVWKSVPVQHIANQVQRMGLPSWSTSSPADSKAVSGEPPVVQTASRTESDPSSSGTPIDDAETGPPAPPEPATSSKPGGVVPELEKLLQDVKAIEESSRPK